MVSSTKNRRREFRRAIAAHGKLDRFSEHMEALGGSRPCIWCDLVRPLADLDVKGICSACHVSWGRRLPAEPSVPINRRDTVWEMPDARALVFVDASYRDGVAGIAVCGALGEYSRQVGANGNNEAEVRALKWALDLAEKAAATGLTFCTDSECAYFWFRRADRGYGWSIEHIPRSRNRQADRLAKRARWDVAA